MLYRTGGSGELKGERHVENGRKRGDGGEGDVLHETEGDNVGIEVRIDDLLEGREELLFVRMKKFGGGGLGGGGGADGGGDAPG